MNKLSFRRIKALMKYEITSDSRTSIIIICLMFLFQLIISGIFTSFTGDENWIEEGASEWIPFGATMTIITLTARYLRPTHTKAYITLPGYPIEKFIAHISVYFIFMISIILLRFGVVELSSLFYETRLSTKDLLLGVEWKFMDRFEGKDNFADLYTICNYTYAFDFMVFALMGIIARRLHGPAQKAIYFFCMIFMVFWVMGTGMVGFLEILGIGNKVAPYMPLIIVIDIALGWMLYRSICKIQAK